MGLTSADHFRLTPHPRAPVGPVCQGACDSCASARGEDLLCLPVRGRRLDQVVPLAGQRALAGRPVNAVKWTHS
jgi:hypothetical protein